MCYEERFFLQRVTTKVQKREELKPVIERLRPSAPPDHPKPQTDKPTEGDPELESAKGVEGRKPWVAEAPRGFRSRPHHLACSSTMQREPHMGDQNTVPARAASGRGGTAISSRADCGERRGSSVTRPVRLHAPHSGQTPEFASVSQTRVAPASAGGCP